MAMMSGVMWEKHAGKVILTKKHYYNRDEQQMCIAKPIKAMVVWYIQENTMLGR